MQDGRLNLTLRIKRLGNSEGLSLGPLIVTSNYIPLADGLNAELIRDGVVEIKTPRSMLFRHRAIARTVFTKLFVERPSLALISEAWQTDPRAAGLAVSQLELRDNWLSVAISAVGSAHAEEVANRSREIKALY